ncbi:MAG TPA: DUF4430 domain-containing protein [Candidatus Thermoplasmatota archaeon]|nr:DUF4430 domain-containing protein [Candidatus Thermoplasmatota archaeon]
MMNMKNQVNKQQLITFIGLILFGTLGRYVLFGMGVQPFPNFEVIMVVTFLAVMLIRSPLALIVPLISMIGSDLLIGNPIFVGDQMNRIVLFTYTGFAIIGLITLLSKNRLGSRFGQFRLKSVGLIAGLGIGSVLLYDIWTNMGWWYLMYPHDTSSLIMVYTAGLPFMMYHLISGIVTFCAIGLPVILYAAKKKDQMHIRPFQIKMIHKIPAVLLVLSLVALSFTGTALKVPQKSEVWVEKSDQTSVRIIIRGDSWTLIDNLVAYQGDTAFSLLERSGQQNGFSVDSTYYTAFDSTLINSINNVVGGTDGKYWQYYVNGNLPTIGADKYIIANGDLLTWSFEVPPS